MKIMRQGPIVLVCLHFSGFHEDYFILCYLRDVFQVLGDLVSLGPLLSAGQVV